LLIGMKMILIALLLAGASSSARSEPKHLPALEPPATTLTPEALRVCALEHEAALAFRELVAAGDLRIALRARWDAAVAAGHPNPAGVWARRHHDARIRWRAAVQRYELARGEIDAVRQDTLHESCADTVVR
jgi:hypothetical protein